MGAETNGLSIGTERHGEIAWGIMRLINIMMLCGHPGPSGFASFGPFEEKARTLRDFIQRGITEGDLQREKYEKRYELFSSLCDLVMSLDKQEIQCPACQRTRDGIRELVSAFGRKI